VEADKLGSSLGLSDNPLLERIDCAEALRENMS
jgi:hypothetical protein